MIERIKEFFEKKKRAEEQDEYTAGYSVAAGKILSGLITVELIEYQQALNKLMPHSPYYQGFKTAVVDAITKGWIELNTDHNKCITHT